MLNRWFIEVARLVVVIGFLISSNAFIGDASGQKGADERAKLAQEKAGITALMVVELPSGEMAGTASELNVLALPGGNGLDHTKFNQEVGSTMQSALSEVKKFLKHRHKVWPKGNKIELAFEEKYSPKDGGRPPRWRARWCSMR
jgi:hypothetical protein